MKSCEYLQRDGDGLFSRAVYYIKIVIVNFKKFAFEVSEEPLRFRPTTS